MIAAMFKSYSTVIICGKRPVPIEMTKWSKSVFNWNNRIEVNSINLYRNKKKPLIRMTKTHNKINKNKMKTENRKIKANFTIIVLIIQK